MAPKGGKTTASLPCQFIGGQWSIGVDFVALAELADLLHAYNSKDRKVVASVNKSISAIAKDAGWKGQTAKKFTEAWEKDTELAHKLGVFEDGAADILADLAIALSWIQKKLIERTDELARTVGLMRFGGSATAAAVALHGEQEKAHKEADQESQKAQKSAADKLRDLYSGKPGQWSVLQALDDLKYNQYVPRDLQGAISKVEHDLKSHLPGEKSLFDTVTGSRTSIGISAGAAAGAVVGGVMGIFGGPPGIATGATLGTTIGGAGGAIWGGISDLF